MGAEMGAAASAGACPRGGSCTPLGEKQLDAGIGSGNLVHVFFAVVVVPDDVAIGREKLPSSAERKFDTVHGIRKAILLEKLPDVTLVALVARGDDDDVVALSFALLEMVVQRGMRCPPSPVIVDAVQNAIDVVRHSRLALAARTVLEAGNGIRFHCGASRGSTRG